MQDPKLQQAISAIKADNKKTGYRILTQIISANPKSAAAENAWMWMAVIFIDDQKRRQQCFETVLQINPNNTDAQTELNRLLNPKKRETLVPISAKGKESPNTAINNSEQFQQEIEQQDINRSETDWFGVIMKFILSAGAFGLFFMQYLVEPNEVVLVILFIASISLVWRSILIYFAISGKISLW